MSLTIWLPSLIIICFALPALLTAEVRIVRLADAFTFRMGRLEGKRIIHPDMGARKLTLNYVVSQPGDEFPQHVHDESDDTFLVLQGSADVRQGDQRRPLQQGQAAFVPAGEIHGTVTSGSGQAILISFQVPPDWALYTGARDSSRPGARPPVGRITPGAVQLLDFMNASGPFVHPGMGASRASAFFQTLAPGDKIQLSSPLEGEAFLFLWEGSLSVPAGPLSGQLSGGDTVFLQGEEQLTLHNASSRPARLIRVQVPPAPELGTGTN